jgi:predicted nucleotidyltransferase
MDEGVPDMNRDQVLETLREHEPELKATGVVSLSLFGSTARGETNPADVDVAVRLANHFSSGGFDYFYQLEQLQRRLSQLLGCRVDVVPEPLRKDRFQREIDRDRALAF